MKELCTNFELFKTSRLTGSLVTVYPAELKNG